MTDALDDLLQEALQDPAVAGAYRDSGERNRLLMALLDARAKAGKTSVEVANQIADWCGISRRRASRLVRDYERGRTTATASVWFVMAYARATGVRIEFKIPPASGLYPTVGEP